MILFNNYNYYVQTFFLKLLLFCFIVLFIGSFSAFGDNKVTLVLGAGGNHGVDYKVSIFESIRNNVNNLYLVDIDSNPVVNILIEKQLIDSFLPIKKSDFNSGRVTEIIISKIDALNTQLDAVVTYREEWLEIKDSIEKHYKLTTNPSSAVKNCRNKYQMRNILEKHGFDSIKFESANLSNIRSVASKIKFPFFIKPQKGIRSEWCRFIANFDDLEEYISDIKDYKIDNFILEEFIDGHELDVDIVLYNGDLMYYGVSDNFPVFKPFALETGHLMPSIIGEKLSKKISFIVYEAMSKFGYKNGVFHVEAILKPNGQLVIVEINGRVGGMYIPQWHKKIWDVDLINAQLEIARGNNPSKFLKKSSPKTSIALFCVTTNDKKIIKENTITVLDWQKQKNTFTETWLTFPYDSYIKQNGHPNIGAIVLSDLTPQKAFHKLFTFLQQNTQKIDTDQGVIESSLFPIFKFGMNLYQNPRFIVQEAKSSDIEQIRNLLQFLNPKDTNIVTRNIKEFFSKTKIFVVKDNFLAHKPIVASISLSDYNRLRKKFKAAYIHDLVVKPEYRGIGIANLLLQHIIHFANKSGIYKIDLACSEEIAKLYENLGFNKVGIHLVKYLDNNEDETHPVSNNFSQKKIADLGEWLYGQEIVKNIMKFNKKIIIPKYFFLPLNEKNNLKDFAKKLCKDNSSYSVKYSLGDSEAFSYNRKRGANSSRGRTLNCDGTSSIKDIVTKLENFISTAPKNAVSLVLQEFIDLSGGCLFHGEFSTDKIETELLWEKSTARSYCKFSTHKNSFIYEEREGFDYDIDKNKACKRINDRLKNVLSLLQENYGQVLWSIEGFWNPEDDIMTVLQLRPTPNDVSKSKKRKIKSSLFYSNFSWGDYESEEFLLEKNLTHHSNILIRQNKLNEEMEVEILKRLSDHKQTIVIDPFRGFRLSHEKWFLPPIEQRALYGFISIPQKILNHYNGCWVKVASSEGIGHLCGSAKNSISRCKIPYQNFEH